MDVLQRLIYLLFPAFLMSIAFQCSQPPLERPLDRKILAEKYFQEDRQWYEDNIPFFECSDNDIEAVYFYRWKMYKAHIRNVGKNQYVITEFINHVPWDRDPFCTINAASMHHIYEGRWLKDRRYMDGYIHYLCQEVEIIAGIARALQMPFMLVISSMAIRSFW